MLVASQALGRKVKQLTNTLDGGWRRNALPIIAEPTTKEKSEVAVKTQTSDLTLGNSYGIPQIEIFRI